MTDWIKTDLRDDWTEIDFTDSGVRFRIRREPDDTFTVRATCGPNSPGDLEAATWQRVCEIVDELVAARPDEDRATGFRGFVVDLWHHEGRHREDWTIPTRGELLAWMGNGDVPAPGDFVERLEGYGDIVVAVRDGDGRMLLDRSDALEDQMKAEASDVLGL